MSGRSASTGRGTAIMVPVKAFADAKHRLAPALDPEARARLARDMATTVVHAAGNLPCFVVCDDEEVRAWALDQEAGVIWTPRLGLNGAVAFGFAHLRRSAFERSVIAHADLPHALDFSVVFEHALDTGTVVVVPDRRDDGTNVLSVPTAATGFEFAYGAGSFARHLAAAERCNLSTRVVRDERLGWDVDQPADLARPSWAAQ